MINRDITFSPKMEPIERKHQELGGTGVEEINAYASVFGWLGYPVHARNFFKALDRYFPVCLVPRYPNNQRFPVDKHLGTMMYRRRTMKLSNPAICLTYGNEMHSFTGSVMVGYTVFESDLVPEDWVNLLNQLDQVWTVSQWGVNILVQNGVREELVHCVPEGVDTEIFKPKQMVMNKRDPEIFRFLSIGKFEPRKGQVELLRAYAEEFEKGEPVKLSMLVHNPYLNDFNPEAEIAKLGLPPHPPIEILPQQASAHHLANLYNSCNAFVLPTRGEAWGLPIIEAMACGLPAIVTNYSGLTEYANADNALLIDIEGLEDVYDPQFYPDKGKHGQWAAPSIKHLRQLMRRVVENREEAEEKGLRAAKEMQEKWQWDTAGSIAFSLLKDLCG